MESINTIQSAPLGNGWKELPHDVIFHIFSWLNLSDIAHLTTINKGWKSLCSNERYWKPIILKEISSPEIAPNSWKDLFNSHQKALSNLREGKYGISPHKQEKVNAIIPYGDGPDQIANRLVLIKDDHKKVYTWNLEGESQELYTSPTSLTPTEIVWGQEGPQVMFFSTVNYDWALIYLKNHKTISGGEKSWAPQDLSDNYLKLARGSRIGVWHQLEAPSTLSPDSYPIPIHKDKKAYFVISKIDTLKVVTKDNEETELAKEEGWAFNFPPKWSFLLVQPNQNSPSYLAGLNKDRGLLSLWDIDTWRKDEVNLESYDMVEGITIQYLKIGKTPHLLCYQPLATWLLSFNPQTGKFIKNVKLPPFIDRLVSTSMYEMNYLFGIRQRKYTGCLILRASSKHTIWDAPGLKDIALCTKPNGQLALAYFGENLQVFSLNQDTKQLPSPSEVRNIFRLLSARLRQELLLLGTSLLLTALISIALYKTSKAIWRALPSIRHPTSPVKSN